MKRYSRLSTVFLTFPLGLAALVAGCGGDSGKKTTSAPSSAPAPRPAVTTSPAAVKNGVEKLSARKILARATKATMAAPAVRVKGRITEDGQTCDIDLRAQGPNTLQAEITLEKQRLQIIRLGRALYMKGDRAFYASVIGSEGAKIFDGKYLKGSATDKELRDFLSISDIKEMLQAEGDVAKAGVARMNGRPAVILTDSTKSRLYVATDGAPVVLAIEAPVGKERLDFLYTPAAKITAPDESQTIDLNKLQKQGG